MPAYEIRFTKRARRQLASEMAWSRAEYCRAFQVRFLSENQQRLRLIGDRPEIHQINPALGEGIRLFRQRGLRIASMADKDACRIRVLMVAGRRQDLQSAVQQALSSWEREQSGG